MRLRAKKKKKNCRFSNSLRKEKRGTEQTKTEIKVSSSGCQSTVLGTGVVLRNNLVKQRIQLLFRVCTVRLLVPLSGQHGSANSEKYQKQKKTTTHFFRTLLLRVTTSHRKQNKYQCLPFLTFDEKCTEKNHTLCLVFLGYRSQKLRRISVFQDN